MKAFLYKKYGTPNVLEYEEVPKPIPQKNELLIKVKASTVSAGVIWLRKGAYPNSKFISLMLRLYFGICKPRVKMLGIEYAGVVESVGTDVHFFKKGDKVFGTTTGLYNGTYADYICVPEQGRQNVIAIVPEGLTMEEAAALPVGGMTAFCILNKAKIEIGHKVLIYGASGSVGTYAIQIAKYLGAHVTAVCSTRNLSLVRSLGADEVIDYTLNQELLCRDKFDLVFDAVGKLPHQITPLILHAKGKLSSVNSVVNEKISYLNTLLNMIDEQKLKIVIDRTYSFVQMVEAHEYVEQGHKRGNVVICH